MNKSELIARLAARYSAISHDDTEQVVTTVLDSIGKALSMERPVELRGFGPFSIKSRPAHMGRNPKNGEAVAVVQKRAAYFRTSHVLLKRMNGAVSASESIKEPAKTFDARTSH
jgi:integration host factor subunit beta